MNEFETQLIKLHTEAEELQKLEIELQMKVKIFAEKQVGFLKEYGLPENWTLPQLALLAIRKARE